MFLQRYRRTDHYTSPHHYDLQCQGQYATRVNDVRSYMQQIDSDVSLTSQQKKELKLGKLMQGNNKGTFLKLYSIAKSSKKWEFNC